MLDLTVMFVLGMALGAHLVVRFMVPVALSIDPKQAEINRRGRR